MGGTGSDKEHGDESGQGAAARRRPPRYQKAEQDRGHPAGQARQHRQTIIASTRQQHRRRRHAVQRRPDAPGSDRARAETLALAVHRPLVSDCRDSARRGRDRGCTRERERHRENGRTGSRPAPGRKAIPRWGRSNRLVKTVRFWRGKREEGTSADELGGRSP